jgi:hypothetical protein
LTLTELEAEEIRFWGAGYSRALIRRCLESAWRSKLVAPCDSREADGLFGIDEVVWALTPLGRQEPTGPSSLLSTFGSRVGVGITVAAAASTVIGIGRLPVSPVVTASIALTTIYVGLLCALFHVHRDAASPRRIAHDSPWLWGERQTARELTIVEYEFFRTVIRGFVVVGMLNAQAALWPDPSHSRAAVSLLGYVAAGTWLARAWLRLKRAATEDARAVAGGACGPAGEDAPSRQTPGLAASDG